MSLKNKTIVGLLLSLFTGVTSVFATQPSLVEDVTMVVTQNGEVAVSWSEAEGAMSYNIYYSRQSILENGGDYDDFESTADASTTHVFPTPPVQGEKMYAAVLAVSDSGEESEGFVSEASVDLPSAMPETSSSAASTPSTTSEPLSLRTVQAVSATGVILEFSKALGENISSGYFVLTDTGGTILRIQSIEQQDAETILLITQSQEPKVKYILGLVQNVPAADGTYMTVSSPRILFDSYGAKDMTSSEASVPYTPNPALGGASSSAPTVPAGPVGPANVDTAAMKQADGTYTVKVTWTPTAEAEQYILYSSKSGGGFSRVGTASATQTSAQLRKVTASSMRIKVAVVNEQGQESAGTVDTVLFGAGTSSPLPESGLPLLGAVLAAGALAGSRVRLKKQK